MEHPPLDTLVSSPQDPEVIAHLTTCDTCAVAIKQHDECLAARPPREPHPASALRAGQRLGRYRIERPLGAGGMSVVYLARHIQLDSLHALKVLKTADTDGYRRLLAEGRAQSRLAHPNLVPVTDIIDADGVLALVMAFVSGPTLLQLLAEAPLTLLQADHLARGILKGVATAHAAGLVHRDLKPGNVLLTVTDGEVRPLVTDFGLVKTAAEISVTRPGTLLGTPAYMSPEQITDVGAVDMRSDVFSLGALLYEILYGMRAFDAPDHAGILSAVAEARYLRLDKTSEVPERMSAAITAALERDRANRPTDAAALLRLWQQGCPDRLADTSHPEAIVLTARIEGLTHLSPAPIGEMRSLEAPASLASTIEPHPQQHVAHLLAERDPFVGRAEESASLARYLARGARLVTVLGFGGAGKTRLAAHHAWQQRRSWPGGVYFCDLTEARSADGILSAVAIVLGIPLLEGDATAQLGAAIAGRGRCLVILDNFEQVVEHASQTLGLWLDRAAEASFVVTSREVLSLPGEYLLSLDPLPEADAEELFRVRALAVDPTFDPSVEETVAIRKLVKLLDGLPLAIELAAARIRAMTPSKQLSHLGERFRLLTGKGRIKRHSTLRTTLDWSWKLLTDSEQAGLCQLAVFEGGLTMEAAEAVLDVGESWPADIVQGLVDKSLLRSLTSDRFGMLVSVKEYAAERLTERGPAEARHGVYYARYGTNSSLEALETPGGGHRRELLARDLDNLVIACRRAIARRDGPVASATALAAWEVLDLRGPFVLGAELLEGAAALAQEQEARLLWKAAKARHLAGQMKQAEANCASALQIARETGQLYVDGTAPRYLGNLYLRQGRMDEARTHLETALHIHHEAGDHLSESYLLVNLGVLHYHQGHLDEARVYYERALPIHRETKNRRLEGFVLGNLGLLYRDQGRMNEALTCYEAALHIHREMEDRYAEGQLLGNLGILYYYLGRRSEALTHYEAALRMHHETGNRPCEVALLQCIGNIHLGQHRFDEARACYEQAMCINREVGDRRLEGTLLGTIAILHYHNGQMSAAHDHYERALHIYREVGNRPAEGQALFNLGLLHAHQGRPDEAHACCERALHTHRETGDRRMEAVSLACLGHLDYDSGRLDEARERCEQALGICREVGDRVEEGNLLELMGNIAREQGCTDEAHAHYTLATSIAREVDAPSLEAVVLGDLGCLYAAQGQLSEALSCFNRGETLLRSASDPIELGKLLARRVVYRVDDIDSARAKLDEAQQIASRLEAGETSALGHALTKAAAALQATAYRAKS